MSRVDDACDRIIGLLRDGPPVKLAEFAGLAAGIAPELLDRRSSEPKLRPAAVSSLTERFPVDERGVHFSRCAGWFHVIKGL